MPSRSRAYFEPRLGTDLGQVRFHVGPEAASRADRFSALAYAHGHDVVWGRAAPPPETSKGRRLLAHELGHVLQARRGVAGGVRRQALREVPTESTTADPLLFPSTPPSSVAVGILAHRHGGLVHDASLRPRVSAILGAGHTIRQVAELVEPLFRQAIAADPSHPAAVDVTVEEIARAIVFHNRGHIARNGLRAGLRLPLPIERELEVTPEGTRAHTGRWIVNPRLMVTWSEALDPDDAALTTEPATGSNLRSDRDPAVRQQVTDLLAEDTTAMARGIMLMARLVSNPVESEPFAQALFDRLGTDAFEVALATMNNMVNHQVDLLGSLGAGAAVLWRMLDILSRPPEGLSASAERERQRALRMLERHTSATLTQSPGGRDVELHVFPGTSSRRALVIGGVHGTEYIGVEVARELISRLRDEASRGVRPAFTTIVVPVLFPDNLPPSMGGARRRRVTPGNADPNRQFPSIGTGLDAARTASGSWDAPEDSRGRPIEGANVALMELIRHYRPERIASIHAIRSSSSAGIYSDPHQGAGTGFGDRAAALANRMHTIANASGGHVPGSASGTGEYPHQSQVMSQGVSLGEWGSQEVTSGPYERAAMPIITLELQRDWTEREAEQRQTNVEAFARAIREGFLEE